MVIHPFQKITGQCHFLVFDKLLKKLMCSRLYKHLQKSNVLYKYELGIKSKHSTSSALIEVTDNIYEQLDNGSTVCGINLNLQKAFDSTSHDILLKKMCINGIVYKWFESYLFNRHQFNCSGKTVPNIRGITMAYLKDLF
jgi:Reverse transcriptase (RNA-dependent DNA polymerase)